MPFKSQKQRAFAYASLRPGFRGKSRFTKKEVERWERETPKEKKLPERVKKKEKTAYDLGCALALRQAGLLKEAAMPPWGDVWSGLRTALSAGGAKTWDFLRARRLREALANLARAEEGQIRLTPEGWKKFVKSRGAHAGVQEALPFEGLNVAEEFAGLSPRQLMYKDILDAFRPYGITAGVGTAAALTPSVARAIFPGLQE